MVFFFTMKGSLWPDSHQRDGGRGDVRGGDGLDRCQGRQGWRRGEHIFFPVAMWISFEAISLFQVGGGERLLGTLAEYTHQNNQNSI